MKYLILVTSLFLFGRLCALSDFVARTDLEGTATLLMLDVINQ
jgi:hypothetical protein